MSEAPDPRLRLLFEQAGEDLSDDAFHARVVAGIRARGRRVMLGRLAIVALIVALELVLEAPLQNSVGLLTKALQAALVPVEHEWLAFVLAPVNSVAGLLGAVLVALHFLYRKLFY